MNIVKGEVRGNNIEGTMMEILIIGYVFWANTNGINNHSLFPFCFLSIIISEWAKADWVE